MNLNSLEKLSPVLQSVGFAAEVLEEKSPMYSWKFNKDTLQGTFGFHEGECKSKNLSVRITKKSSC